MPGRFGRHDADRRAAELSGASQVFNYAITRACWRSRLDLGCHRRFAHGLSPRRSSRDQTRSCLSPSRSAGDQLARPRVYGRRRDLDGVEPRHEDRVLCGLCLVRQRDDVSNLLGVGRHLGSQPRANTSITIIRAPQRGHGQGSTRGASGAISDCCRGSAAGEATSRNARAVAMFSARLALAKSP